MFTPQIEKFFRIIIDDIIEMLFTEPTDNQMKGEVRKAFGLIPNVEYSIKNGYIYAEGDTESASKFTVGEDGHLYVIGEYNNFKIENNHLIEV